MDESVCVWSSKKKERKRTNTHTEGGGVQEKQTRYFVFFCFKYRLGQNILTVVGIFVRIFISVVGLKH